MHTMLPYFFCRLLVSDIDLTYVTALHLTVLQQIVEMLRRRVFLPTAGVTTPRRDFNWEGHNLRVQLEPEPFPQSSEPVVVGVNSFGIGGSFGHVVLEEYKPSSLLPSPPKPIFINQDDVGYHLLPLSASSTAHLRLYAQHVADYLRSGRHINLRDVCGTFSCKRTRFAARKCIVASDPVDMADQLTAFMESNASPQASLNGADTRVAFVFTGQGSQYQGAGMQLMVFPVYRNAVRKVDALFQRLARWSILDKLQHLSDEEMRLTCYAQPITFLVQVGLVELFKYMKVLPDMVVGHSAGEVAANYACGLLSLEEAVSVVYHRSVEQQKLEGCGRLLAVGLGSEAIVQYIRGMKDVEVACINSPESVVLASSEERLKEVAESLPIDVRRVFVPGHIAFHSSRTEPILKAMEKRLYFLNDRPTIWSIPCISTVTGHDMTCADAAYWCSNVRQPVMFRKAIETMFSHENQPEVVLEIGPHRTLVAPVLQTLSSMKKQAMVIPTLKRKGHACQQILEVLGLLYEKGLDLALDRYAEDLGSVMDVHLPRHPFIRKPIKAETSYIARDMLMGMPTKGPIAGAVCM